MTESKTRGQSRGRAYTTDAASKALVTANEHAIALAAAGNNDYGEYAGEGIDDIGAGDIKSPFIRIIQTNSAQCDEAKPQYDKNVRPGQIYHSGLGSYFSKEMGFGFIPCWIETSYTEWVPQDQGGGFRGKFAKDDARVLKLRANQGEFKKLATQEGTEIIETHSIYGLVTPRDKDGTWLYHDTVEGIVAFTSTQIPAFKEMAGRIKALCTTRNYPLFAFRWNFSAVAQRNKKGSFFGWRIQLAEEVAENARLKKGDPLIQRAGDLRKLLLSGEKTADFAQAGGAVDVESDGPYQGRTIDVDSDVESEIPF